MKGMWKEITADRILWGVVLAKLAVDQTFPWGAVPVIFFLLSKPLADGYIARLALKRDVLMKNAEAVEQQLRDIDKRITETQNRLGSLSLAAGLKRQGP